MKPSKSSLSTQQESAQVLLEARELSAGYGKRPVVEKVSFSLHSGEALALVGPNAAGKSTLIRALSGQIPLQSGEVRLCGRELSKMDSRKRARAMALVPQSSRFDLDFSVLEMIAFGRAPHSPGWTKPSSADQKLIEQAMAQTQVKHLAARSFGELSGGERQRVLLARALAQNAQLMLLDEPTAHLDLGHQLLVIEQVLTHCRNGGAALVVLHDLALAARLNRVAVLHKGMIQACDTPEKALNEKRLREIWGIEARLQFSGGQPSLLLQGPGSSRDDASG